MTSDHTNTDIIKRDSVEPYIEGESIPKEVIKVLVHDSKRSQLSEVRLTARRT